MDKEIRPYHILGACNPKLADRVIDSEPNAGVLLPCKLVLRETEAGKTTVVNMIRGLLPESSEVTVFCFDAWMHEGDPLRRTYLESLIDHFQKKGRHRVSALFVSKASAFQSRLKMSSIARPNTSAILNASGSEGS